jgi:hypothetical protein
MWLWAAECLFVDRLDVSTQSAPGSVDALADLPSPATVIRLAEERRRSKKGRINFVPILVGIGHLLRENSM